MSGRVNICVRVIPAERERLVALAKAAGVSLQSFCYGKLLEGVNICELSALETEVLQLTLESKNYCAGLYYGVCESLVERGLMLQHVGVFRVTQLGARAIGWTWQEIERSENEELWRNEPV